MTRDTFSYILSIIQTNPVFQTPTINQQRPIWQQLAVTLVVWSKRYWTWKTCSCTGQSTRKDLWLELVLLFDLAYLEPWGLLMLQISTCISVLGGRQRIVQSKVPLCHVQLICNDRKMIRAAKIGWPGSCYDNTIWQRSKIFQNKHLFFRGLSFCLLTLDTPTPLCLASSTSNLKLQSLQTIYSTICSHKLVAKLNMSMVYWSTLDLQ